jgi:signal transduction histidine kinase
MEMSPQRDPSDMTRALASEREARRQAEKRALDLASELERVKAAERQARAETAAAAELHAEFVSSVSHDLRGPIGTILTWAHLMRNGRLSEEKAAHALDAIARSSQSQLRMLERLVDLARLRLGRLEMEVVRADVGAAARAAVEEVRGSADTRHVLLDVDASDGLDVAGDPKRLTQAIGHLLENAIDATPDNGRVDLLLRRHEEGIEIVVRDTGSGLDPALAKSLSAGIREPDQRSRARRGLGLPLARGLTELHAGSLELTSEGLGRGTIARMWLPAFSSVDDS